MTVTLAGLLKLQIPFSSLCKYGAELSSEPLNPALEAGGEHCAELSHL